MGKTSLLKQYEKKEFTEGYRATIGADCVTKQIEINERVIELQLWDTAGQEQYQSLQRMFYKGAEFCVIVYDITDPKSFEDVAKWRDAFFDAAEVESESFPVIIVGNKADMASNRKVSKEKAMQWCRDNGGALHFEASAKTAANVEEIFETIAKKVAETPVRAM